MVTDFFNFIINRFFILVSFGKYRLFLRCGFLLAEWFPKGFVLKDDDLKFWVEQGQSSAFKMNRLTPIECIILVFLIFVQKNEQRYKARSD